MKNIIKLKNGINLVSHKLDNTHSVTISVSFRTGSLYENDKNKGITHLVEHLFFRRWYDLSQDELYFSMMSLGAEITGSTYNDYVSFSITVVPDFFVEAFILITKCLNKFHWNDNCIIDEKRIVYKQIENSSQSYRNWLDGKYFSGTAYERPIMGTVESVQRLSANEINMWKDKYFCCNNSFIAVTGNYNDNDFSMVKRILSNIDNSGDIVKPIACLPINFCSRDQENKYTILYNESENCDVTVFLDIKNEYNYETIRLLSSMLGEGCGSILSSILCEKYGFTDEIYTDLICFCGFYRLSISFDIRNYDFFDCMTHLLKILLNLKKYINKYNYCTTINFFTRNQLMDYDNNKALNSRYVLCDFVLSSVLSEPQEVKVKYEKISVEDLQEYASEIICNQNISFLIETNLNRNTVIKHLEDLS